MRVRGGGYRVLQVLERGELDDAVAQLVHVRVDDVADTAHLLLVRDRGEG